MNSRRLGARPTVALTVPAVIALAGAGLGRWELGAIGLTALMLINAVLMMRYAQMLGRGVTAATRATRTCEHEVLVAHEDARAARAELLAQIKKTNDAVVETRQQGGDRHARTRKAVANLLDASEATRQELEALRTAVERELNQLSRAFENQQIILRRDMANARRLEGERHARTRKLLGYTDGLKRHVKDERDAVISALEARERRLLGFLATERLALTERHEEILDVLSQHAQSAEGE